MNKNDLVNQVSDSTGLNQSDSKSCRLCFRVNQSTLKSGGDVRLVGFGTFLVSGEATTGRNPQTGESLIFQHANVPKFRAGKALKESLN